MKPFLGILALLVLGSLALLLFTDVLQPSRAAGETAGAPARETATPRPVQTDLAPASPEVLADTTEPAKRALVETVEEDRFGEWAAEPVSRWVEGRVALPVGAPPDPDLLVLVLAQAAAPSEIYGRRGLVTRLQRQDRDELPANLISKGTVGADGSFKVPFPADRTAGHLVVAGSHLYSKTPTPFDLESGSPIEVKPSLGAMITGRILLPAERDNEEVRESLEIELAPDMQQFSMIGTDGGWLFRRAGLLVDGGRYEIRAVDTGRPFQLEVESDHLAKHVQGDLDLDEGETHELDVSLLVGATVRGLVADEGGRPVAGAEVRAMRTVMMGFPGAVLTETESDDQGAFVLDRIPPGRAVLVAEAEGMLESSPEKLVLEDEEVRADLALVVEDGASISGVVRWVDGRPAADCEVEVSFDMAAMAGMTAFNVARGADGEARTDAEGRFVVTGLGKGPFAVACEESPEGSEDVWKAAVSGIAPGTEGLELVLRPRPSIAGVVVDTDGQPMPKFRIHANKEGAIFFAPGTSKEEEFEDEQGEFLLEGLDEGTWSLSAAAEGFGQSQPMDVVLAGEGTQTVTLVLEPAATITGTVLDTRGQAIGGAKVTLAVESTKSISALRGDIDLPEAISLEDGTFELTNVTPGEPLVIAQHAEYAESEPVATPVAPGELVADLVLKLRAGAYLSGEVYGPDGDFMRGAQIIVQDPETFQVVMRRTDESGFFEVDHLKPGTWSVTAMLGDAGTEAGGGDGEPDMAEFMKNMRFTSVEVADGEEKHVVLGAPPANPVRVTGRVTHGNDPVADVLVSFIPHGGGMDGLKIDQANAEGRFEVELPEPGRYLVQVQSSRNASGFEQQNVEFSEVIPEVEAHELQLVLPVGKISGRVRGAGGDPLPGTRVTLTTSGGIAFGTMMGGNYAESTTDQEGNYEFEFLRPGSYAVAAGGSLFGGAMGGRSEHGRIVRSGLEVREASHLQGVDFKLEQAGEIAGIVLGTGGTPVRGASIFVRDQDGMFLERFTMQASEEGGKFRLTGIAPGRYTLIARTSELVSSETTSVVVRSGEVTETQVTVDAGTILLVTVVDQGGEELEARITVEDSSGRTFTGLISYADILKAMGQGEGTEEQRIGPLPPDRYVVTAVTDDGREERKPVNLSGQSERRLKIRIR